MRSISLLLAAAAVTSCSTAPQMGRSADAQLKLNDVLAGRTAGPPMACLPPATTSNMIAIDENTILFRRGSTVYRNDLRSGGCGHLQNSSYSLVTRSFGSSSLCAGDTAQVADVTNGMIVGSCVLGDFVPYTMPRG